MTDNIWISIIIWLLDLLSVIITAHYQFFKSLFPPFFVWYLWQPNIRLCTWSAKVWHVYDRAGTWSSRGQNSRSTYSVSPQVKVKLKPQLKLHNLILVTSVGKELMESFTWKFSNLFWLKTPELCYRKNWFDSSLQKVDVFEVLRVHKVNLDLVWRFHVKL